MFGSKSAGKKKMSLGAAVVEKKQQAVVVVEDDETKAQKEQLDQLQQHLEQLTRQEKKLLELHQGREDKLASTLLRALRSQALVIKQRIQVVQAGNSFVDPYNIE
jgi:hypothetical protein